MPANTPWASVKVKKFCLTAVKRSRITTSGVSCPPNGQFHAWQFEEEKRHPSHKPTAWPLTETQRRGENFSAERRRPRRHQHFIAMKPPQVHPTQCLKIRGEFLLLRDSSRCFKKLNINILCFTPPTGGRCSVSAFKPDWIGSGYVQQHIGIQQGHSSPRIRFMIA